MRSLSLCATLLLAGLASAQQLTVTGTRVESPAGGTSGGQGGASFPGTLPSQPAESTATAPTDVMGVNSITLTGRYHSWIGDLQVVLEDPNGVGHLIFVRPGYMGGADQGNPGDFVGLTYTFIESGAPHSLPDTSGIAEDPPPGTYNQSFWASPNVQWPDGAAGIFNTPMSQIAGPSGDWTLKFYDWLPGDTGLLFAWSLDYNSGTIGPGTSICFGDGSGTTCPCSNPGAPGAGCATNFTGDPLAFECQGPYFRVGTTLLALGSNSLAEQSDPASRLVLMALRTTTQPGLFFPGENTIAGGNGTIFGDGLRCCGQSLKRLELMDLPSTGPGIHCPANGSTMLDLTNVTPGTVVAGMKLCYQYWYRNPGIRSLCGSNFNLSNAVSVIWAP